MNKDWNTIEFLRHVRHDWLNKIQLLKGNLDLNKTDRVKEIINEIIMESKQEAKLSNLDIPEFATKILVSNWENYYFQVEYEVLAEVKCQGVEDAALTNWTIKFFELLNQNVKPFADNHLFLSIDSKLDSIRFVFDFSGIIENIDSLTEFLEKSYSNQIKIDQLEVNEQELVFELLMESS
ncbi:Spo0B C-terminal domain-containing protein [Bacillus sp. B1-b2]|uniref:Spo0B C-terminal domain-containing protein n=1 Tax=Bacillus sp. B1-b2 TaxID=2653201 RepID=UPI001261E71A|nr:Spo0B C-terminal domain-containing protein [Bacillus sp. B1-b2]KAB7667321.1 sporulation protein [Bacillus sp. B1-b2]